VIAHGKLLRETGGPKRRRGPQCQSAGRSEDHPAPASRFSARDQARLRRRLIPTRPTSPVANRVIVPGSGTTPTSTANAGMVASVRASHVAPSSSL